MYSRHRYVPRSRSDMPPWLAIVILLFAFGSCGIAIWNELSYTTTQTEATVRILDTTTKTINNKGAYLISVVHVVKQGGTYVDTDQTETFTVEDSFTYGKFRSADVYFDLSAHKGAVYYLKLQGWRSGYWSKFRNIVEYNLLEKAGGR